MKVIAEFLGTALLVILGDGAVGERTSQGQQGICFRMDRDREWQRYRRLGAMVPVMMFHQISAQINPAVTIGLAPSGRQSWSIVPAFVTAQLLEAPRLRVRPARPLSVSGSWSGVWSPVSAAPAVLPSTPRVTAGHASCMPLDPLKYKGGSQWWYPWVPVAAPIAGALVGVGIFSWLLG
jgi:glycerol uptake facilitator-like aquaporin